MKISENLKNVYVYIKSDYVRYGGKPNIGKIFLELLGFGDHSLKFSIWLRLSSKPNIFRLPAKFMLRRYSLKYGLYILPETSIGYGFYLAHGIGVVINPTAVIGDNCEISQFVTIGSNKHKAATIGNNVYIGPSVCIVEDIKIGNYVTIGAGAVVITDIPDYATAVGVPARVAKIRNASEASTHT